MTWLFFWCPKLWTECPGLKQTLLRWNQQQLRIPEDVSSNCTMVRPFCFAVAQSVTIWRSFILHSLLCRTHLVIRINKLALLPTGQCLGKGGLLMTHDWNLCVHSPLPTFLDFQRPCWELSLCFPLQRQQKNIYIWKWKSLSRIRLFATPWTPWSPWNSPVLENSRVLEWVVVPYSSGSS